MHRFASAAASSLIAATALIGGCNQGPTGQPEPERTYFTLAALCGSGDATPKRMHGFLDLPVDVNAKDEIGWTPLSHAESGRRPKNAELIRSAGGKRGEALPDRRNPRTENRPDPHRESGR